MQWFLLRRLTELLFLAPLIDAFADCHGIADGLKMLGSLDEVHKIGLMGCLLIAGTGVFEITKGCRDQLKVVTASVRTKSAPTRPELPAEEKLQSPTDTTGE